MKWRDEFAPAVEQDVAEAADWYESRQPGLGAEFVEEIIRVWEALADNPLLHCRPRGGAGPQAARKSEIRGPKSERRPKSDSTRIDSGLGLLRFLRYLMFHSGSP
jgi:hypothetical protein